MIRMRWPWHGGLWDRWEVPGLKPDLQYEGP